jgi:hypothetical protein
MCSRPPSRWARSRGANDPGRRESSAAPIPRTHSRRRALRCAIRRRVHGMRDATPSVGRSRRSSWRKPLTRSRRGDLHSTSRGPHQARRRVPQCVRQNQRAAQSTSAQPSLGSPIDMRPPGSDGEPHGRHLSTQGSTNNLVGRCGLGVWRGSGVGSRRPGRPWSCHTSITWRLHTAPSPEISAGKRVANDAQRSGVRSDR